MAFIDDIINYGSISGKLSRSQTLEADHYVWHEDFESSLFKNYTLEMIKYYERASVQYRGVAELTDDLAEDIIYNRIWINTEIDFGLIVEIRTDTINIWNAYLYQTSTISDFDDPGHTGIDIDPVTLPTILEPNEEKNYTVTVYPSGPANQDTIYTFTINGENYTNNVIGVRILPFPLPANWVDKVSMEYGYETSIYTAPTTHEQRRSLIDDIRRATTFSILATHIQAQKLDNLYRKGVNRFFGIPIHNEKFTTYSTLTGQTSIVANEDITYFYNLQNLCDNIMIVDKDSLKGEIKVIDSIVGNTVNIELEVTGDFDPNNCVIYPVFIGMMETANFKNVTDSIVRTNVTFKEKFVG